MVNLDKLRNEIEAAGIRQGDLAVAIGRSGAQVSRLLAGKRKLGIEDLERILAFLRSRTGRVRGLMLNDIVESAPRARRSA